MSNDILGYTREGMPIKSLRPGMVYTACTIVCCECRKTIRGMGGPSMGSICTECWPKKVRAVTLLVKRYSDDELCDVERDVIESFDSRFTPQAMGLPDDGTYTVIVKWEPNRATAE